MVVLSDKLVEEKVWLNKSRYSDAEKSYYEKLAKLQKEGEDSKESSPDNVKNETKTEASPKKRRKRNSSNKEEQVPNRNPPGTKDIPAKRNSVKEKNNVKFDKDRKDSETLPESPMKKVKEPTPPKDPEPEDLAWDAVDTQADTVAPVETKVESEPAVDDKKKKDKKKNKKNDKKGDKGGSGGNQGHAAPLNLNTLASEVAKARHHIKTSLDCINDVALMTSNNMNLDHGNRISQLEKDNRDLKSQVDDLLSVIKKLEGRIASLEKGQKPAGATPAKPPTPAKAPADDDDDVDLFGSDSDEEDEAAKKVKEQRLAEYSAKKSKKPALIAKSNIILDVKPWDDETDMKEMEKHVREITMDGLLWGASKLVPLAYGIHKLQISCVVEDDKVSVDLLTETIEEIEDYVQSVDIAAFNKV